MIAKAVVAIGPLPLSPSLKMAKIMGSLYKDIATMETFTHTLAGTQPDCYLGDSYEYTSHRKAPPAGGVLKGNKSTSCIQDVLLFVPRIPPAGGALR